MRLIHFHNHQLINPPTPNRPLQSSNQVDDPVPCDYVDNRKNKSLDKKQEDGDGLGPPPPGSLLATATAAFLQRLFDKCRCARTSSRVNAYDAQQRRARHIRTHPRAHTHG